MNRKALHPLAVAILALAALLPVRALRAEDPAPSPGDPLPIPATSLDPPNRQWPLARWSVEAVVGATAGGSADSLYDAMFHSGWGDSAAGFFGSTSYPSKGGGVFQDSSYWLAVRHRIGTGPLHVGLAGGRSEFGTVEGHHVDRAAPFPHDFYLTASSEVDTYAGLVWFEMTKALRAGAGPSLNVATVHLEGTGAPDSQEVRKTTAGFVAELGFVAPVDTPVYFVMSAQYRYVPPVDVPGWTRTSSSGASASFAPVSVPMSHAIFSIGIGGRW